jgi:hypothetical protein
MKAIAKWSPLRELEHDGNLMKAEFPEVERGERARRPASTYGSAVRSFAFPDGAVAEFTGGILKVHLLPSPEVMPRSIDSSLGKRRQGGIDAARLLLSFQIRNVISIRETIGPFHDGDSQCEVWASAEGNYDECEARLEVKLDSYLRRSTDSLPLPTSWLPGTQTVISATPFEEGAAVTKEMFKHWVKRVRRAVPFKGCRAISGHYSRGFSTSPGALTMKPIDTVDIAARFEVFTNGEEVGSRRINA